MQPRFLPLCLSSVPRTCYFQPVVCRVRSNLNPAHGFMNLGTMFMKIVVLMKSARCLRIWDSHRLSRPRTVMSAVRFTVNGATRNGHTKRETDKYATGASCDCILC